MGIPQRAAFKKKDFDCKGILKRKNITFLRMDEFFGLVKNLDEFFSRA